MTNKKKTGTLRSQSDRWAYSALMHCTCQNLEPQNICFLTKKLFSIRVQASLVAQGEKFHLQCRRCVFDPRVGKIPWRRKWQPTPVSLPGKSYGQRRLESYNPQGRKVSDLTQRLSTHAELINNAVIVLGEQQWGLSHTYTCVHSTPNSPLFRLSYSIDQSSMCHLVGPCWLSILNIAVCTCPFQTPKLSLPFNPYSPPFSNCKSVL